MAAAALALAALVTAATPAHAPAGPIATAAADPFLGKVSARLREAARSGAPRLLPAWLRADGPPPAPVGLWFESRVDVEGAGFADPTPALARHLSGRSLRHGATAEGPPLGRDLERHRAHVTPGADFMPLLRWLHSQMRGRR